MLKRTPTVYIPVEPQNNGVFIPFILSILVHILIIAFVFFTHRVPDIEIPQSIETSIITQAELEAIEARIGKNRSEMMLAAQNPNEPNDLATMADNNTATANDVDINIDFDEFVDEIYQQPRSPKPIVNTDTPATSVDTNAQGIDSDSSLITSVDDITERNGYGTMTLSEQERLYQQRVARYAAELDADAQAQQRITNDQDLSDAQQYNQRITNVTPTQDLNSGRIHVDIAPAQQAPNNSHSGSDQLANSLGGTRAMTAQSDKIDTAAVQQQLRQLIYSRWSPPAGSTGKQITAIVHVDTSTGKVIKVSITGTDNAILEQSLEDAIYAGALTPVIGTNLETIRLILNVK